MTLIGYRDADKAHHLQAILVEPSQTWPLFPQVLETIHHPLQGLARLRMTESAQPQFGR